MVRLDKFLADAGIASRRELKAILKSGAVRVNGKTVTDGAAKLDPARDRVSYGGQSVEGPRRLVLLLHKPAGYVTSTEDPRDKTVMELIPEPYFAEAARRMTDLMHRHPRLIRGTDYLCTRMNADPGAVAKGGASGVYAFGLKKSGLGVMLKLYDGTESAWQAVIARILCRIAPDDCPELLRDLETKEFIGTVCRDIRCMTGEKIGELRSEFDLEKV